MNNLNVVDQFLQTFITYIDSGFGFLQGDVKALTTILIGIDMTLAALFWSLDGEANILAKLLKKVLYVGAFNLIINNFTVLSVAIYKSFAGLGLNAAHSGVTAADLLKPGKLAGIGFQAGWPLLQQAGSLLGFTTFFNNAVTIAVLLFAWVVVILSFFILAVQLFVTILEFKLTSLAGFILVPFALWNKTAFLAERVLGHVVTSGIKVMVLAVIVGIGTTFFGQFTAALNGQPPSLSDAMSLALASLSLFGLGIFGPSIATGLVSGAPQLGAGSAFGTAGTAFGTAALAGAAIGGAGRAISSGGLSAIRAGTSLSTTEAGIGRAGASASASPAADGAGLGSAARPSSSSAQGAAPRGKQPTNSAGISPEATREGVSGAGNTEAAPGDNAQAAASSSSSRSSGAPPPNWARRLRSQQWFNSQTQQIDHTIEGSDRPGPGAIPKLRDEEED